MNRIVHILVIVLALTPLLFGFQACNNTGFQTRTMTANLASENADGSQNGGGDGPTGNGSGSGTPTIKPSIVLAGPLPTLFNSKTLSVSFRVVVDPSSSVTSAMCQLDGNVPEDCSSQNFTLSNLSDGDHTLHINAKDSFSQLAPEFVGLFRVDTTAPNVTISQFPAASTGATSATFIFQSTDDLSGVESTECSTDSGPYTTCASPFAISTVAEGAHSFSVRAIDKAKNVSISSTKSWTVSLGSQVLSITQAPKSFSNSKAATFAFSGTQNGVALTTFECQLDSGTFSSCAAPKAYSNLAEGVHSFAIRSVNTTGTPSAPVLATWTVDTLAPNQLDFSSNVPLNTNQASIDIAFHAVDAGVPPNSGIAALSCSFDGSAFAACTSPFSKQNLTEGKHSFQFKATDGAGNISRPLEFAWTIDLTAPVITLTTKPPNTGAGTSAQFAFSITETGSGIVANECQLDGAAFKSCASTMSYSSLFGGSHTFQVRARDAVGNQGTATYTWSVVGPTPTPPPVGNIHYVRSGAAGAANGADWANACPDFVGACSPANLVRGETYYVAGGTYTAQTWSRAVSGTTYVTIKKATVTEHGTVTGWADPYGTSQAVFVGENKFTTGYWDFDGSTSYGFKFDFSEGQTGATIGAVPSVSLRYIDFDGISTTGNYNYSASTQCVYISAASTGVHLAHDSFHGGESLLYEGGIRTIVEYSHFYNARSISPNWHNNVFFISGGTNGILRYNLVEDYNDEGFFFTGWDGSPNGWKVYGNVFWSNGGEQNPRGIEIRQDYSYSGIEIYNNTFVNLSVGGILNRAPETGNVCAGCIARNNLSYNSGNTLTGMTASSNTDDSTNRFVNLTAADFRLKSSLAGEKLSSEYDVDILGTTRGADGIWDRGAYEITSPAAVAKAGP